MSPRKMRRTIEKRREVHPSSVLSPAVTHYPLRRALLIINRLLLRSRALSLSPLLTYTTLQPTNPPVNSTCRSPAGQLVRMPCRWTAGGLTCRSTAGGLTGLQVDCKFFVFFFFYNIQEFIILTRDSILYRGGQRTVVV